MVKYLKIVKKRTTHCNFSSDDSYNILNGYCSEIILTFINLTLDLHVRLILPYFRVAENYVNLEERL